MRLRTALFLLAWSGAVGARAAPASVRVSSAPAKAVRPGKAGDVLRSLEDDPSPAATKALHELYLRTRSRDQRFWLVQALGARLKSLADEGALRELLLAASDSDPNVRGPALRAMQGFVSLPKETVRKNWLVRLDAAATKGGRDPASAVRSSAEDLRRALRDWRHSYGAVKIREPKGDREPEQPGLGGVLAIGIGWLWLLGAPLVVASWAKLGLPVFDRGSQEGRRAQAAWRVLRRQPIFLGATAVVWLCLSSLLAGYGFDLLVRACGTSLYELHSGWLAAYLAAGMCLFVPGAVLAGALPLRPSGPGVMSLLRGIPWGVALSVVVFLALFPAEVVWRLLIRRAPPPTDGAQAPPPARSGFHWVLETGAIRAAYLALGVIGCEGHGLGPALERASQLFPDGGRSRGKASLGVGAFDSKFALFCAAPALAFFCVLVARRQPVEWHVSIPVLLVACSVWAWCVLAGLLFAVTQTLEGVNTAGDLSSVMGREAPRGWEETNDARSQSGGQ